jgi:hypothetical protein
MNTKKRIFVGVAAVAVAAITAYAAGSSSVTFRTLAYFIGLVQGTDLISGHPRYEDADFAGHNLVNLAMGRNITATNVPSQVLAMTFECDLSAASLVVFDLATSNVVATIASSTNVDSVMQQDAGEKGPNRAHFVTTLAIGPNGNATNGILGGYFTVAGRVNLNPVTGCPEPVIVGLDRDPLDALDGDIEVPPSEDADSVPLTVRTGLGHLIGVLDAVTGGTNDNILIPHGSLSIRRELPGTPIVVSPAAVPETSHSVSE